mmetsp:Transcript_9483/g.24041  ORF Transcript_9483/g.24041 Transcript_9483/m.24041 type:complete len:95 (-) Transcript_9483:237-521(-)
MATASAGSASSATILRVLAALAAVARHRNGAADFLVHSGGMTWGALLLTHEALQPAEEDAVRDLVALQLINLLSEVGCRPPSALSPTAVEAVNP